MCFFFFFCEDIEKYKNEILLKMMSCELKERVIPDFGENKENLFIKYYIEEKNPLVMHFFLQMTRKIKMIKKIIKDKKISKNIIKQL